MGCFLIRFALKYSPDASCPLTAGVCLKHMPPPFIKVTGRALNDSTLECVTPAAHMERVVSVTIALRYNNTERNILLGAKTER